MSHPPHIRAVEGTAVTAVTAMSAVTDVTAGPSRGGPSGRRAEPFHAAITGIGMITAAGQDTARTWQAVVEGRPTTAVIPELAGMPVQLACQASAFDGDAVLGRRAAWRLDRCTQMALVAGREAVADAGLTPGEWDGTRVGTVLGSALGGIGTWQREYDRLRELGPERISPLTIPMSLPNLIAGQMATDLHARGPSMVTSTACASGTTALGVARDLLRHDSCDIVITGGAESSLVHSVVAAFARAGALSRNTADPDRASRPFDVDRDGFVIAEAAAILVLEHPDHARARGAHVYAYVSGYGASADAGHETRPDPEGAGAQRAVEAALRDAELFPTEVDHVNAHGTSTPLNDLAEGRMVRRVIGGHPLVTAAKGVTGHSLGAAGAVEAALTALTLRHQIVPPTAGLRETDPAVDLDVVRDTAREERMEAALSNSFGFGGQNAALILTRA